jgi:hypothetical protein
MDRYEWPLAALTIALHRRIYLAFIMDRYERSLTDLTIAFHRGLYLAIIMDQYGGPHHCPNYSRCIEEST